MLCEPIVGESTPGKAEVFTYGDPLGSLFPCSGKAMIDG